MQLLLRSQQVFFAWLPAPAHLKQTCHERHAGIATYDSPPHLQHHGIRNPHKRAQVEQQNSSVTVVVSGIGDMQSVYVIHFMDTTSHNLFLAAIVDTSYTDLTRRQLQISH